MLHRLIVIAVTCASLHARTATAQVLAPNTTLTFDTAVTFTMAVNLTKLSPDLDRVGLICMIMPSAVFGVLPFSPSNVHGTYPYRHELPVVAGQVVGTMQVVYPIATQQFLADPTRQTADYQCELIGYSRSLQRWNVFSATSTVPAFLLQPTPPPIQGTFPW